MTEQEEKILRDEIFQEEMLRAELRNLSSEDLLHIDNIITGINALQRSSSDSSLIWSILFTQFTGIPLSRVNGIPALNKKEDNKSEEITPTDK